jgi:hypothetical protein
MPRSGIPFAVHFPRVYELLAPHRVRSASAPGAATGNRAIRSRAARNRTARNTAASSPSIRIRSNAATRGRKSDSQKNPGPIRHNFQRRIAPNVNRFPAIKSRRDPLKTNGPPILIGHKTDLCRAHSGARQRVSASFAEAETLAWIIHDFAGGKRKGALKD